MTAEGWRARLVRALDFGIMRQSVLYVASLGLGKIVQLLAIFLYSHFLAPGDFGFYAVFTSYIWILAIAISMNAHLAIGRYLYEGSIDNELMLSTVVLWIAGIAAGYIALAVGAFSIWGPGWSPLVWACLLVVSLGFVADSIITQVSAYAQNAKLLLIPSALRAALSSAVTIAILLTADRPDAMALIIGDALGTLPVIICLFLGPIRFRLQMSWTYLRRMFAYALPLTPYMLALTLLSQFDRIVIASLQNERAAGLYSLSYNFGALPLLASTALTSALTKRFFDDLSAGRFAPLVAQANYAFGLSALCFAGVMAFGQSFALLMLPSDYAEAFDIIPIVAYAGLVFTLFQIWVRVLAFRDRPGQISLIATCGIALNVGLNVLLVPVLGYKVAAWTTVLAYVVMTASVLLLVRTRQGIRELPLRQTLGLLMLGAVPLGVTAALEHDIIARQAVLALWFALFAISVFRPIMAGAGQPRPGADGVD